MSTETVKKSDRRKPADLPSAESLCKLYAVKEMLRHIRPFFPLPLPDGAPRHQNRLRISPEARAALQEEVLAELYAWSLACQERWVADESKIQFGDHNPVDPLFSRIAIDEIGQYCKDRLGEKARGIKPKAISDTVFGFRFCGARRD